MLLIQRMNHHRQGDPGVSSKRQHEEPPEQKLPAGGGGSRDVTGSAVGYQDSEEAFPFRIYSLLEDAERLGFSNIVSWVNGGIAFMVHDRDQFSEQILPVYFSHKKFKSFQRQLNLYQFDRASSGPFKGSYSHQNLVRGHRKLCHLITRVQSSRRSPAPGGVGTARALDVDARSISKEQSNLIRNPNALDALSKTTHSDLSRVGVDSEGRPTSNTAPGALLITSLGHESVSPGGTNALNSLVTTTGYHGPSFATRSSRALASQSQVGPDDSDSAVPTTRQEGGDDEESHGATSSNVAEWVEHHKTHLSQFASALVASSSASTSKEPAPAAAPGGGSGRDREGVLVHVKKAQKDDTEGDSPDSTILNEIIRTFKDGGNDPSPPSL